MPEPQDGRPANECLGCRGSGIQQMHPCPECGGVGLMPPSDRELPPRLESLRAALRLVPHNSDPQRVNWLLTVHEELERAEAALQAQAKLAEMEAENQNYREALSQVSGPENDYIAIRKREWESEVAGHNAAAAGWQVDRGRAEKAEARLAEAEEVLRSVLAFFTNEPGDDARKMEKFVYEAIAKSRGNK